MAQDQNIIQDAIDRDVASGKLAPINQAQNTADRRKEVAKSGYYDIYIEIDCDCEELVDACGLEYEEVVDDTTQNEICLSLDADEWSDFSSLLTFNDTNEQSIGSELLNYELGEYVTKVTIYKPSGDIISFS